MVFHRLKVVALHSTSEVIQTWHPYAGGYTPGAEIRLFSNCEDNGAYRSRGSLNTSLSVEFGDPDVWLTGKNPIRPIPAFERCEATWCY